VFEALDGLGDSREVLVEGFDVRAVRQVEQLEDTLHRVLDHAVHIRLAERDPVAQLPALLVPNLDDPADIALEVVDAVGGVSDPFAQGAVEGIASPVDQIGEQRAGDASVRTLAVYENLRQRDRRDVLTGLVVDHLHVLVGLEKFGDALERDVATRLRVVELAICVTLDEDGHAEPRFEPTLSGGPAATLAQAEPSPHFSPRLYCGLGSALDGDALNPGSPGLRRRPTTRGRRRARWFLRIGALCATAVPKAELPEDLSQPEERAQDGTRLGVVSGPLLPEGDLLIDGPGDRIQDLRGTVVRDVSEIVAEGFEELGQRAEEPARLRWPTAGDE
jgi:hypothetical protein